MSSRLEVRFRIASPNDRDTVEDRLNDLVDADALVEYHDRYAVLDAGGEVEPSDDRVRRAVDLLDRVERSVAVEVLDLDLDLVDAGAIAGRVGVSRETVRQWVVTGLHSAPSFPAQLGLLPGRQRVWAWGDVAMWIREAMPARFDGVVHLTDRERVAFLSHLAQRRISADWLVVAHGRPSPTR
jgi:hypothetical protein